MSIVKHYFKEIMNKLMKIGRHSILTDIDMNFQFDNVKLENDYYDRKEMIKTTAQIFGEMISDVELEKRAQLWHAADHLIDADTLAKLAQCPYVEVREGVAANKHTSVKTLELLLKDDDFEVQETAVFNPNLPISKVRELLNDENQIVCDAAKRRLKSK